MKSTKRARTDGHSRRGFLAGAAGLAGILATGRAPAFAQTAAKKLVFAHINPSPESAAVAFTAGRKQARVYNDNCSASGSRRSRNTVARQGQDSSAAGAAAVRGLGREPRPERGF